MLLLEGERVLVATGEGRRTGSGDGMGSTAALYATGDRPDQAGVEDAMRTQEDVPIVLFELLQLLLRSRPEGSKADTDSQAWDGWCRAMLHVLSLMPAPLTSHPTEANATTDTGGGATYVPMHISTKEKRRHLKSLTKTRRRHGSREILAPEN